MAKKSFKEIIRGFFDKISGKTAKRIAIGATAVTVAAGGAAAIKNVIDDKEKQNEKPTVESQTKNEQNEIDKDKNIILENGTKVVIEGAKLMEKGLDKFKESLEQGVNKVETPKQPEIVTEQNENIQTVNEQNYNVEATIEDLDANTSDKTFEQINEEKREEVGLKEDEITPEESVNRTVVNDSQSAEELAQKIAEEATKPKKETETKKVEVKTDDNKTVSVKTDGDVKTEEDKNGNTVIAVNGTGATISVEDEKDENGNVITKEDTSSDTIAPVNPFEEDANQWDKNDKELTDDDFDVNSFRAWDDDAR